MNQKIDSFFTPTSKTARRNSSPESEEEKREKRKLLSIMGSDDKVGNMNFNDLMQAFSGLLDSKLQNIPTREDILILSNKIEEISVENKQLKKEINAQKDLNKQLNKRLEFIERETKKNNLIFKGLNVNKSDNCLEKVKEFCSSVLNTSKDITVSGAKILGSNLQGNKNSILVEFPIEEERYKVLKSAKILRGTGYSIDRDLTLLQRQIKSKLLFLRRCIKQIDPKIHLSVYNSNLFVNNIRFLWSEEVGILYNRENGVNKLREITNFDFSEIMHKLIKDVLPEERDSIMRELTSFKSKEKREVKEKTREEKGLLGEERIISTINTTNKQDIQN